MFEKLLVRWTLPQSMLMVEIAARMDRYGVEEVMIYSALDHVAAGPFAESLGGREDLGKAGLEHKKRC